MVEATYRTISTLLAEVALPVSAKSLLASLQLANSRVHALGHVLICRALGSGNEEKLNFEFADLVRGAADNRVAGSATLALHAAGKASFLDSPLIESSNLDHVRSAIALGLVLLEADVGASKAAIVGSQGRHKIPGCRRNLSLPSSSVTLCLSKGLFFSFHASLHLLPLLGAGKDTRKGRRLRLRHLCRRGGQTLGLRRSLELYVQCQLKLEVIGNDQLKLLANGGIASKFKPSGCHTVNTVVEGEAEPRPFICFWSVKGGYSETSVDTYFWAEEGQGP